MKYTQFLLLYYSTSSRAQRLRARLLCCKAQWDLGCLPPKIELRSQICTILKTNNNAVAIKSHLQLKGLNIPFLKIWGFSDTFALYSNPITQTHPHRQCKKQLNPPNLQTPQPDHASSSGPSPASPRENTAWFCEKGTGKTSTAITESALEAHGAKSHV